MTRIFLSHSSKDNPRAFALAQWLRENGWEDVFLDRIPRQGIAAGDDWKARIHEAMDASEAGIFLISQGWMASEWCRTELTLAYNLNKLIFGVLIDDLPRDQIPGLLKANWQLADLHGGRDHDMHPVTYADGTVAQTTLSRSGLSNLKEGLRRAEIAPEHFSWPPEDEPDRAPWRGLSPMEPADAGIFFGREAQTARALDTIRALREGNAPRLLAIVGASGAGKSSFMRAGLIPRLQRDDRNYLTLVPIRPEGGALDAFAKSLGEAAAKKTRHSLGDIRRMVHAAATGALPELTQFLSELALAHRLPAFDDQAPPVPTILLPIDQGEELFRSSGRAQGGPFLLLLAQLLRQENPKLLALITIRSDSYEPLQNAPELTSIQQSAFSLPAVAKGEYARIITGPIEKLQSAGRVFEFDPAITDTLLAEFERGLGRDALPLLAFTLERLYRDYHGAGRISLTNYSAMGGIAGSIDAAVEAAKEVAGNGRLSSSELQMMEGQLRRTMIPWFAGIDPETGSARRNVSARDQLPPETMPLVDALIDQRLLASDGNMIEPAHEALLREWRQLNGWLVADRERLTTLEALRRAAADWQAKGQRKDYLVHKDGRLEEAEALATRPDLWQQLGLKGQAYLAACRTAVNRVAFARRRNAAAFAAVIAIGLAATAYLWLEASAQAELAEDRNIKAQTAEAKAAQSEVDAVALLALSQAKTNPDAALKLILGVWPKGEVGPFPKLSLAFEVINTALLHTRPKDVMHLHDGRVQSIAFSPDGRSFISGGSDGTLRLWDVASGMPLGKPLRGHEGAVNSVDISPDGRRIVSGGTDGMLHVWDASSGTPLGEPLIGHEADITAVAFSPDGKRIVSGSYDGTLRLWDTFTYAAIDELRGHESPVHSVAFSPDGSRIVSGGYDSTLHLWDAASGAALGEPLRGHELWINSVAFSPDGRSIVSGSADLSLRLWDVESGAAIGAPMRGHEGEIMSVAFSPDGRRIVSAGVDGMLQLWDSEFGAPLGEPQRGHKGAVYSVTFSPDGNRILSGDGVGMLLLWDSASSAELHAPLQGHENWVNSVAFSPDGNRIVSGSSDGTLRLWDAASGTASGEPLRGHEDAVDDVNYSPDGRRIVSGGIDGTLRLWDVATGAALGEPLSGPWDWIHSVTFSPDGNRIVSAGNDGTLRLWEAATGSALGNPMRGHDYSVLSVTFSPDGSRIVSGGDDNSLRLWEAATGTALGNPMRGHEDFVLSVAFSPDGSRIVSGSVDGTLRLWDGASGVELLAPLRGHEGEVQSVAFSPIPDDKRIVSGGSDGTLRFWDATTGLELGAPLRWQKSLTDSNMGSVDAVLSVAFSPDGRRVVTGGTDGAVRQWGSLPPGNILQVACRYLPHVDGKVEPSIEGLADVIGFKGLTLPKDCDTYDPPLPPEFRQ